MNHLSTELRFCPISVEHKAQYERCLAESEARGCEYSFANLYMWGEQKLAFVEGQAFLCSRFGDWAVYPHPVGVGDRQYAIEAIIAHAEANGNPCRISGIRPAEQERMAALFPNRFTYSQNIGSHDYVYDINDLADLSGRKYHAKRNHCKRFESAYSDWRVLPLDESNFALARSLIMQWYEAKEREAPEMNFAMEKRAVERAFGAYRALELEGLLLMAGETAVAVTVGNHMTSDTFDINFEKALSGYDGAYALINREFARYLRAHYPAVAYLNREEDMGLEGLRRAKQSYYPHHQVEKYRATLISSEKE